MTITSYNPRTGQANGTVEEMSSHEVQAAVERASGAGSAVAAASPRERRGWLHAVAAGLVANTRNWSNWPRQRPRWVTRASPPRSRARPASCASTAMWPPRAPTSLPRYDTTPGLARVNQPLGPVAVFGASNFPFGFGVLGNDFGSALAAGCPVIAKSHPAHPLLSHRLAGLARDGTGRRWGSRRLPRDGGRSLGSGQFCTKPGLVFAPAGTAAVEAIGKALRQASPEPVMLTAAIARSTAQGLEELRLAGARVVELVEASIDGWCAPAAVLEAPIDSLRDGSRLLEECFGAVAVIVEYADVAELAAAVGRLQGSLAGSVFTADRDDPDGAACLALLSPKVGRLCANNWPTGVAYTWAQQHGGPWPSTSDPSATSVGAAALCRFVRPITYQSLRDEWLPPALQTANPWDLPRRVNGELQPLGATP